MDPLLKQYLIAAVWVMGGGIIISLFIARCLGICVRGEPKD